ncbi:MAG: Gfo/Idh/MocA family oxidoreductase [Candidatus Sumerlaeia bacterium]
MEQLKVNIIGIGIMGTNVAKVLALNPQARITAASALRQETLDKARAEFKLERTYTDYEKMIAAEKPDVVYVCTPDQAHLAPVMACLESGIHVQVEKPMATSEADAAAMVRKVDETGLKLQVSFNHRWLAVYHQTKQIIKSGQIGRPVCGYARKNNPIDVPTKMVPWAKDSSPMWFLSCHDIDLMTWWFDEDPVEVKAFGHKGVLKKRFDYDCYDAMQGLVKFGSGAFATFEAAWIYPECHPARPDSFMEVIGEQGHMHLDRKMEQIEMSSPEGMGWPRSLLMANVFGHQVGAFPSCVNSFIEIVLEDKKPIVSAYDGWRSTAILDAIHRSADSGQTISVPKAPVL